MKVHIEGGRIVKIEGSGENKAAGGILCQKGLSYIDYVYSPNRVMYPMVRTGKRGEGNFKRVSWKEAIELIGGKLKAVKEKYGPLGVMFYSSGGCLGLMSEYYNGFFSQFGGCTTVRGNLCYPAGIEATKLTYGEVRHNAPWDLENAGLIVLWGKNPAHTNIQEMRYINNAIAKGGKLITIDPVKSPSASKSHLHIMPRPGTDIALALGVINLLIGRGSIDEEFISKYTLGFEELKEHVKKYTPILVSEVCGIEEKSVHEFAALIEGHKPMTLVSGYGLQRNKNAGQIIRAISMIPALTGNIGIKGGGFRFANKNIKLKWPFIAENMKIRDEYPVSTLGRALEESSNPGIGMLWVERANPLTMNPDSNGVRRAMDSLDYIVAVDQFMTDTTRYADIVLPAQSSFEYEDIFKGYWTPYLSYFKKVIDPVGEAKNESEIYRMLGQYMGYDMKYLPEYDAGTIDYILKYSNIDTTVEQLKIQPYGGEKSEIAFEDRVFNTPSGKIELYSRSMINKWGESPLPEYKDPERSEKYPLTFLSTHARERIHSQFGSLGNKKKEGEKAFVYITGEDAAKRDITDGDRVTIFNDNGRIYAYAAITDKIKQGVVNIFEGLQESTGANVNKLTHQGVTDIGYGPTFYDCCVEVEKCGF